MTTSVHLRELRASRAAAPQRAGHDRERHQLYSAALEQFEQLLNAARITNPAARPLSLFYALSQAGRATAAARGEEPRLDGHGLSEERAVVQPPDLLHRRIRPSSRKDGLDSFGAVSRILGSPPLTEPVAMGAVWAALPDTHRIPRVSWLPEWRNVLDVMDEVGLTRDPEGRRLVRVASFSGNPLDDPPRDLLSRYPSLPHDTQIVRVDPVSPGSWIVTLSWSASYSVEAIAPSSATSERRSRHLLPTLPLHSETMAPLMSWWVLLFGLSLFARYHPELWIKSLQVDESLHAVPLESLLDGALEALPVLVADALLGA